jgi:hypothetical protein
MFGKEKDIIKQYRVGGVVDGRAPTKAMARYIWLEIQARRPGLPLLVDYERLSGPCVYAITMESDFDGYAWRVLQESPHAVGLDPKPFEPWVSPSHNSIVIPAGGISEWGYSNTHDFLADGYRRLAEGDFLPDVVSEAKAAKLITAVFGGRQVYYDHVRGPKDWPLNPHFASVYDSSEERDRVIYDLHREGIDACWISKGEAVRDWDKGARMRQDIDRSGYHANAVEVVKTPPRPRKPKSLVDDHPVKDCSETDAFRRKTEKILADPTPRCGQTWKRVSDGFEGRLVDTDGAFFTVRLETAERVTVPRRFHPEWEYVSGPTAPETMKEALRRIVEWESQRPPEGYSSETFRGFLLSVSYDKSIASHDTRDSNLKSFAEEARRRPDGGSFRTWVKKHTPKKRYAR